jgi:hypothetical protein
MTVRDFDRGLGRTLHMGGGILCVVAFTVAAYIVGMWSRDAPWPYDVLSRRLLTEEVAPGGRLRIERVVDYHDDCNIRYERRVQSSLPEGRRYIPEDQDFEHPPWDRSGKAQQSSIVIPTDFPCGPAYLVETVSVACNLYQRIVSRRSKRDVITPFFVTGCTPP